MALFAGTQPGEGAFAVCALAVECNARWSLTRHSASGVLAKIVPSGRVSLRRYRRSPTRRLTAGGNGWRMQWTGGLLSAVPLAMPITIPKHM
jgi:hypothetical protein